MGDRLVFQRDKSLLWNAGLIFGVAPFEPSTYTLRMAIAYLILLALMLLAWRMLQKERLELSEHGVRFLPSGKFLAWREAASVELAQGSSGDWISIRLRPETGFPGLQGMEIGEGGRAFLVLRRQRWKLDLESAHAQMARWPRTKSILRPFVPVSHGPGFRGYLKAQWYAAPERRAKRFGALLLAGTVVASLLGI